MSVRLRERASERRARLEHRLGLRVDALSASRRNVKGIYRQWLPPISDRMSSFDQTATAFPAILFVDGMMSAHRVQSR